MSETFIRTYSLWFCEYYGSLENDDCGLDYTKKMYENIPENELEDYCKSLCREFNWDYRGIILNKYVKLHKNYCIFFEEEIK